LRRLYKKFPLHYGKSYNNVNVYKYDGFGKVKCISDKKKMKNDGLYFSIKEKLRKKAIKRFRHRYEIGHLKLYRSFAASNLLSVNN